MYESVIDEKDKEEFKTIATELTFHEKLANVFELETSKPASTYALQDACET